MIESIVLSRVATYDSNLHTIDGLAKINYFFGANASGKTTISKVIADQASYRSCQVIWRNGVALQPMVYNRDFVARTFNPSTDIKGIFTLGEKQAGNQAKLEAALVSLGTVRQAITNLTVNLEGSDGNGGKRRELNDLEAAFNRKCWEQKQKYDEKYQVVFEGLHKSQEKFKARLLLERETNTAPLLDLAMLEVRAKSILGQQPTAAPKIQSISKGAIIAAESDPILGKRVIGKEDVDIAKLIMALGNSDWVKAGREYVRADAICPFCQQKTPETFRESLEEFFDESYAADTAAIASLARTYAAAFNVLEQQLQAIVSLPSRFLDLESFRIESELFTIKAKANLYKIESKRKEPSQVFALDLLDPVLSTIEGLIAEANKAVDEHNAIVANFAAEKSLFVSQVWRHLLDGELKDFLKKYNTEKIALGKAIDGITKKRGEEQARRDELQAEIRELQRGITSVVPTITAINSLLKSFGFHSFTLQAAATPGFYQLVRQNGDLVKETLSEGERTFITFLYFYHLLKGSDTENAISMDRIVVFDDPVSSLDSDVLFIVSALIKLLFDDVRAKTGHIKQVFVLTHNVYFHKEVAFNARRKNGPMSDETFWIVRKDSATSSVEAHPTDPITTYYEMLWAEVRNRKPPALTIQNTLRRILENYFRILGKLDPDVICRKFEGRDRVVCKSLFSWVNDGSHSAHDDLYVSTSDSQVALFLEVFKRIFEQENHGAHYRMMMREDDDPTPAKVLGAGQPLPPP